MIYFKDGTIDERRTICTELSSDSWNSFAYVSDGKRIDKVSISDYYPDNLDFNSPMRGGSTVEKVIIDYLPEDTKLLERFLLLERLGKPGNFAKEGDIVKVVKGRKHKGKEVTIVSEKIRYYYPPHAYGKVCVMYMETSVGSINASNLKIIGRKGVPLCQKLTL